MAQVGGDVLFPLLGGGAPAVTRVTGGGLARCPVALSVSAVDWSSADGVLDVFFSYRQGRVLFDCPCQKKKRKAYYKQASEAFRYQLAE